jgi:hypothetical protein
VFWVLKFCKFPVTLNRSPVVPEMYPPAPMLHSGIDRWTDLRYRQMIWEH